VGLITPLTGVNADVGNTIRKHIAHIGGGALDPPDPPFQASDMPDQESLQLQYQIQAVQVGLDGYAASASP
jgi:hypothetical protein